VTHLNWAKMNFTKVSTLVVALLCACMVVAQTDWNSTIALRDAYLSYATECDVAFYPFGGVFGGAPWNCTYCLLVDQLGAGSCDWVVPIQDDYYNLQGFVAILNTAEVIVAFRGTVCQQNVNTDEDVFLVDYLNDSLKVHQGFNAAYNAISANVSIAVKTALVECMSLYPSMNCSIRAVGHSLGGALATLAAADLASQNLSLQVNLQTFGSPRVGNSEFVVWLFGILNSSWRNTNWGDPIPLTPAPGSVDIITVGPYVHLPNEVFQTPAVDGGYDYQYCESSPGFENPNCSNSLGNTNFFQPLNCQLLNINFHTAYMGIIDNGNGGTCVPSSASQLPVPWCGTSGTTPTSCISPNYCKIAVPVPPIGSSSNYKDEL
jgi:hypothetical protein